MFIAWELKLKDTVQPEILAGIKFGSWALNRHCKNIGGFKMAVWKRITIRIYASMKYWRIFIWWLQSQTAKLPNLIPRHIFWLHCSSFRMMIIVMRSEPLLVVSGVLQHCKFSLWNTTIWHYRKLYNVRVAAHAFTICLYYGSKFNIR